MNYIHLTKLHINAIVKKKKILIRTLLLRRQTMPALCRLDFDASTVKPGRKNDSSGSFSHV